MTTNYTSVRTMEEAKNAMTARNASVKASSPAALLEQIKQGNERYRKGRGSSSGLHLLDRSSLVSGQAPKVMLLGCADSRVPTEIIFDQGIGDVFVTRNAGNQWGKAVAGTIDYAFDHLGIKLLVVMGHEGCNVVQSSRRSRGEIASEPPLLSKMLTEMSGKLELCAAAIDSFPTPAERNKATVIANARAQAQAVLAMPGVAGRVQSGELMIVHAYYTISTGEVHFFAPTEPLTLPPNPKLGMSMLCGVPKNAPPLPAAIKTTLLPSQVLTELRDGNARFWTGQSVMHTTLQSHFQRRNLTKKTRTLPKAMILGCADSRVPVEIVFDQPIGDVFVTRNAGNLFTELTAGSAEYAVKHLGVKVIVVLGHQSCGAVNAARLPVAAIKGEREHLSKMLLGMNEDLKFCRPTLDHISDPKARDREAVIINAQVQVRKLSNEPGLKEKVASGELAIVAAFYEITSGIVDFI